MKYLLVLAVVMVAFYLWRNNRVSERAQEARKAPPPAAGRVAAPTVMVACQHCGTHLPETEATQGRQGAYCNAEHLRLHESGTGRKA